jgi:hypothetical protein
VGTIEAGRAALTNAQQSAGAVATACSGASGTVTSMAGVALPDCDIVAAAWARFATATQGYVSAFGAAADILGQKVGAAAATYQGTEHTVAAGMTGTAS